MKAKQKYREPSDQAMRRILRHLIGEHLQCFQIVAYRFNGDPLVMIHAENSKDCVALNALATGVVAAGGLRVADAKDQH